MQKQLWKWIVFTFLAHGLMFSPNAASEPEPWPVTVRGHFPIIGKINVRVFQSLEDFYRGRPFRAAEAAVTGEVVTVVLDSLPPGSYLISVRHDANADGRMNSNAFGTPTESAAFHTPEPATGPVRPRNAFFDLEEGAPGIEVVLPPAPADYRSWGAGIMTLIGSNPYKGGDTVVRVLPMLTFVGEHLYVAGPRAGYTLIKSRWFNAGLSAEYKFAGDAFEDEAFLEGMDDRRDTLMAGVDAGLRGVGRWRLDMSAQTDVLNRHDGQEVTLSLSRMVRGRKWSITPGAGLVWRSSNYNNYYFGVRTGEATDDRPAYLPGSSVEWFARALARLELSESWSLLGSARVEMLSSDVRNSPIVDKDLITTAFIGLNYAF